MEMIIWLTVSNSNMKEDPGSVLPWDVIDGALPVITGVCAEKRAVEQHAAGRQGLAFSLASPGSM